MRVCLAASGIALAAVAAVSCSDERSPPGGGPTATTTSSTASGGSGGSGGQQGAGGSIDDVCEGICAAKSEIGCADYNYDTCWGECFSAPLIMPWCDEEAEVWVRCAGLQPAGNFVCHTDPGKQPKLKQGVCAEELDDLFSCWFEGPSAGLPDLSDECATMCLAQSQLACYSPSCEEDCTGSMADGVDCNGAFAGMVYCLASQTAPAYICGIANTPELVGDGCEFYDEIIWGCENI